MRSALEIRLIGNGRNRRKLPVQGRTGEGLLSTLNPTNRAGAKRQISSTKALSPRVELSFPRKREPTANALRQPLGTRFRGGDG